LPVRRVALAEGATASVRWSFAAASMDRGRIASGPRAPRPARSRRSAKRAVLTIATLVLGACGGAAPGAAVTPAEPASTITPDAPARWFHAGAADTFWVWRDGGRASVVSGGARLELTADGVVTAAAWDAGPTATGDPILGALAVPARLGGGHVLWSHGRVFRASTLTGTLEPISPGPDAALVVRGARSWLSSVVVFTEAGARELRPGSARLEPAGEPALADVAAVSAEGAVALDVFGRARATVDGGARWADLTPQVGTVRQLVVGPGETWLATASGRWLLDLDHVEHAGRGVVATEHPEPRVAGPDLASAYAIAWSGGHAMLRDDWPSPLRDASPLAITVAGGVAIGDGTAFGVLPGFVLRVDLATGKLLRIASEWLPSGLSCDAVRVPDGVLFACVADRSQGYGGYVLRSVAGGAPVFERAFSDDGVFVASDDGAVGFAGSCLAEPRLIDPRDPSRSEDLQLPPVLCVRVAPGVWTERRVTVGEDASLAAWVPRRDGGAVAILASNEALPPPVGARRATDEAGVTVLRVYPEVPGYLLRKWSPPQGRLGYSGVVDRRFEVRGDGSIAGWLPAQPEGSQLVIGCTLDRDGEIVAHELPPGVTDVTAGGSFGLARGREHRLYETTDHGRTWRAVGSAPAPPPALAASGCSALGCAQGPVVRVGWGDAALSPQVPLTPTPSAPSASPPLLVCAPHGAPVPLAAPPPAAAGERESVSTGWGDTMDFEGSGSPPDPAAAPPAPRKPRRRVRRRPSAAPVLPSRVRAVRLRRPFAPFAPSHVLRAPGLLLDPERAGHVVPLLEASGEISILVEADEGDMVIAGDELTWTPALDPRRGALREGLATPGLALPGGRGLVLIDARRRLAVSERGAGISPPPVYLGAPRAPAATYALARRDDGAIAVLVADGGAAGGAGFAVLDRVAGSLGPVAKLAPWATVRTSADPRCAHPEPGSWRAVLMVDPTAWLAVDEHALPRTTFAHQGLLRVRWGAERVCLEAIDASLMAGPRDEAPAHDARLIGQWSMDRDRGATLRTGDLLQELSCAITEAPKVDAR
jgi:hypothetical protein